MTLRHLVLLGVLALSGCGTLGGGRDEDLPEPPNPSDFEAEIGFQRAWSYSSVSLPVQGGFGFVPAVGEGRVYVAGSQGRVAALETEGGKLLWEVELDRPVSAGPGAGGDLVVVGTRDGQVIGLSAEDGRVLWRSGVTSEVLAPPQVSEDLVVVRTLDGRVFGLNPASGRRRWLFEQSVPPLTLRGIGAPVLVPGRAVILGLDSGKLVALNPEDGKLFWETTIATPRGRSDLERMVDIDADPLLHRGDIFVAAYQGQLAAVEPGSGRIKWQREFSGYAGLAADATRIYATGAQQQVWAFDRFSGASIWRQDALRGLKLTGPALAGEFVLVGDDEGYLNWLSPQDGSLQRRQKIGGAFVAAPRVSGGAIYLLTEDGLTVLR